MSQNHITSLDGSSAMSQNNSQSERNRDDHEETNIGESNQPVQHADLGMMTGENSVFGESKQPVQHAHSGMMTGDGVFDTCLTNQSVEQECPFSFPGPGLIEPGSNVQTFDTSKRMVSVKRCSACPIIYIPPSSTSSFLLIVIDRLWNTHTDMFLN